MSAFNEIKQELLYRVHTAMTAKLYPDIGNQKLNAVLLCSGPSCEPFNVYATLPISPTVIDFSNASVQMREQVNKYYAIADMAGRLKKAAERRAAIHAI